jgi:predicted dehydrogenase
MDLYNTATSKPIRISQEVVKKMAKKSVNVAIVGMGIGKPNGRALSRNARSEVVALCDLEKDRMVEFAAELPGDPKLYTDYKRMCKDPEIDAVFVGTPNQWHVPIALEAVRNGKHVMVTKPLADSERAARKLVEAAESEGVVNMMSLSTRFGQNCRYLGNLARENTMGELYYARARSIRRSGIPAWNLGFIKEGGGAFRDMGVHVLDAAWWILGLPNPVTVSGISGAKFGPKGEGYWEYSKPARSVYTQYAADDYSGGLIRFENDSALQVESFWASHQPEEFQIELFGTKAGARLLPLTLYKTENDAPQDISVNLPGKKEAWDTIAEHFVECILDGKTCSAPLRHGYKVQKMMEALLKSARTGKEVRITNE